MGACMHLNGLPPLGLNDLVRMLIPCLQCGCMQSCVLTPTCFSRPSQPSLSLGPALMVKRGIFWTVWTVLDPKESAMRPRIDRVSFKSKERLRGSWFRGAGLYRYHADGLRGAVYEDRTHHGSKAFHIGWDRCSAVS